LKFQGYLLDILDLIGTGLQRDIITDQYVKNFHDQIDKDFHIKAHDIELEDIVDGEICGTEKKSDRSIPGNTLLTQISKLTANRENFVYSHQKAVKLIQRQHQIQVHYVPILNRWPFAGNRRLFK
jgi:hypothetical protein